MLSIEIMVFWDVKLRHLVERHKWTSTVLMLVRSGTGICTYLLGGSLTPSADVEYNCNTIPQFSFSPTGAENLGNLYQQCNGGTCCIHLSHPNIIISTFEWVCLKFTL